MIQLLLRWYNDKHEKTDSTQDWRNTLLMLHSKTTLHNVVKQETHNNGVAPCWWTLAFLKLLMKSVPFVLLWESRQVIRVLHQINKELTNLFLFPVLVQFFQFSLFGGSLKSTLNKIHGKRCLRKCTGLMFQMKTLRTSATVELQLNNYHFKLF